jgi:hypothetical protein
MARHQQQGRSLRRAITSLCAALTSGVLMAGCGGSSAPHTTTTVTNARALAREAAVTRKAKTSRDTVARGGRIHRPLHGTGGEEINDDNPGTADAGDKNASEDPCRLVSRAQASSILGQSIAAPQDAPLGPTCIYQATRGATLATIALQTINVRQIHANIKSSVNMTIDGRRGFCGDYGQPTTFVALRHGNTLAITAPCKIGKLLAVVALRRLEG